MPNLIWNVEKIAKKSHSNLRIFVKTWEIGIFLAFAEPLFYDDNRAKNKCPSGKDKELNKGAEYE